MKGGEFQAEGAELAKAIGGNKIATLVGTEESLMGTGVRGDGWAVVPLSYSGYCYRVLFGVKRRGCVPLLLLSSLHHTRTCACPPCSHTHTSLGDPWLSLGRGFVADHSSQEKLCSPPTSTGGGDLGVSPKERKHCFLVYVEMGKTCPRTMAFS